MTEIKEILYGLLSLFDINNAMLSFTNFIGSGYILVIILAVLFFGVVKKIVNLIIAGFVAWCIWMLFSTGAVDMVISSLQNVFSF